MGSGQAMRTLLWSLYYFMVSPMFIILLYMCMFTCLRHCMIKQVFERVSESNGELYCVCWDQKPVS